jgi:FkbM family methyltransferase
MTQSFPDVPPSKPKVRDVIGAVIPPIEIFDIGAGNEGEDRYSTLLEQELANVSAFEANPRELEKLRAAGKPRRRYFPHFVGKGGGATFHFARYSGCSSLYEPDPRVIDLFMSINATTPAGNFTLKGTEQVETVRLDDIPELGPCDFLKADVQGAELDVLQGATRTLGNVLIIECEVEFVPLYKDQPLFGDIQVFLRQHNFVLHKFIDINGRTFRPLVLGGNIFAPMSQVLWADAVFVRDFSRLELYSDEQLIKTAAVLYGVYHSYDLALRMLTEHDRRRHGALASRFNQILATARNLPYLYMNVKLKPTRKSGNKPT